MSKKYYLFYRSARNVLATSVIASVFAFSLANGHAFADNHEVSTGSLVEETIQQDQIVEAVDTTTQELTTDVAQDGGGTEPSTEVETENPTSEELLSENQSDEETDVNQEDEKDITSLLPGDFFYFTKKLLENVQLALTFNEVKEAELLAGFAEERIKEAEALLAQGEEDLANEILQEAIEQQELALAKYDQVQSSEEEEPATEETTEVFEDDAIQELAPADPVRAALEEKFAANLTALQTALEKVENPKAREALAKIIIKAEKKFEEKINKKLAKVEEKEKEADKKRAHLDAKLTTGEIEVKEYNEELTELNEELAEEKAELVEEISKEADEVVEAVLEKTNDKEKGKKQDRHGEDKSVSDDKESKKAVASQIAEEKQREESEERAEKEREEAKKQEENKRKAAEKHNEKEHEDDTE